MRVEREGENDQRGRGAVSCREGWGSRSRTEGHEEKSKTREKD